MDYTCTYEYTYMYIMYVICINMYDYVQCTLHNYTLNYINLRSGENQSILEIELIISLISNQHLTKLIVNVIASLILLLHLY